MIKQLLLISSLCLCSVALTAQNTIANGAFENWTTTNYEEPTFYSNANRESLNKGLGLTVTKSTDAFHGAFAIQLSTIANATDTSPGYIYNGAPQQEFGNGGLPYNEQPTGIRFYYKPNFMPNDTGLALVMFKKNGASIGLFSTKLFGTSTTYQLFEGSFSGILNEAPDSIIIALVSSNFMVGSNGIHGSSVLIDSLTFTGVTAQPTNLNGDFEQWQNATYSKLSDWDANENATLRTTNAYAGTSALELFSYDDGGGARAGSATNGSSYPGGTNGGDPFSNQIDTLMFHYIYTPAPTNILDSATIILNFKKNGATFAGYSRHFGANASYTYGEMPFSLGQAPDTILLFIQSSNTWNPTQDCIGSTFIIDEICFKSNPLTTGIPKITAAANTNLFPNPSANIITINSINTTKINLVSIVDVLGRNVYSGQFSDKQTQINISNLAAGNYSIIISTDSDKKIERLIKE